MRPERWLDLLAVVVIMTAAALGYSQLFEAWTYLVPALGAAVAASLVAAYGRVRNAPVWLSAIGSLFVGMLFISYAVLVDTLSSGVIPSSDTISALRAGIVNGFGDTLQAALPVPDQSSTHVFVVALIWLGTMITAEAVLRSGTIVLPTIPALVVFALSLPMAATLGELSAWVVSAVVAGVLIFLLIRSAPELSLQSRSRADELREVREFHSRTLLGGRLTLGIPVILLAAVLGPLISGSISFGDDEPFDPREFRDDRVTVQRSLNPLAELKAVLQRSETDALRVSFRNSADALALRQLRLVTLDDFTGAEWRSTSSYLPSRGTLPELELDDLAVREIEADIEIVDDIGPWLPSIGEPVSVNVNEVDFDSFTRDILAGDITSYTVRGVTANPSPALLDAAEPDLSEAFAPYTELDPAPPPEIGDLAAEITAAETTAIDRLRRLEEFLLTNLNFDPDARPGHSYADIVSFLTEGRTGYSEQYATAFALMARSQGFPTRLVIGYKVTEETDEGAAALETVTNRQYHVWPEVKLDVGWIAFEPSPATGDEVARPQPEEQGPGTTIAGSVLGQQDRPAPQEEGPSEETIEAEPGGFSQLIRLGGTIVALAVGLLVLVAILIFILKRRRRKQRRSAPVANDRILGAWAEVHDRLVEAGLSVPGTYTVEEAIDACETKFGGTTAAPLQLLAPHVDRAIFAEFVPPDAAAAQAWTRAEDFEQALAPNLSRVRRVVAKVDPRTLRQR